MKGGIYKLARNGTYSFKHKDLSLPHKSFYLQLRLTHPVEFLAQRHTAKVVITRGIYLDHQISFLWSVCATNLMLQKLHFIFSVRVLPIQLQIFIYL